jgi:hypothetical protein
MPLSVSALFAGVYLGAQGLLLAGAHTDVAGTQHGTAFGAILQAGAEGKRVGARVEGIPPVSLAQKPSAYYGQATPQLSLINGAVRIAIDPGAHLWAGAGETVINQRTPLPNLSQVVSSRLAGARLELMYRMPLGGARFFEATIGAAPHLTGSDHYTYSIAHPPVDKPEIAAEEDAMLAYGVNLGSAQVLLGLRTINFSARYALTGAAGDRNNGAGIVLEYRRFLLR